MNRKYLLDSLDGLKGLVFRLLPADIRESIACVPMTTDGPWTDEERAVFERAIAIPGGQTYWAPGGFVNVPPSTDHKARSLWVGAIAAINQKYLFLDPDTGFYTQHTGESEKMILVNELAALLDGREALIVYRHQYWPAPRPTRIPATVYPYVWHSLNMLRDAGFNAFAYQSQTASCFFVAAQETALAPLLAGFRVALAGVSHAVIERRIVLCRADTA
jgi:hypothetical protein